MRKDPIHVTWAQGKRQMHYASIEEVSEEWCKNWRKRDLWFGKLQEEFDKISTKHSKLSKLGLWWDPFVQSRKCMSLKVT